MPLLSPPPPRPTPFDLDFLPWQANHEVMPIYQNSVVSQCRKDHSRYLIGGGGGLMVSQ